MVGNKRKKAKEYYLVQVKILAFEWRKLMNEVELSVIMPVYNAEKFLKDSIESILEQTFSDFEFIIIDDGSTDRSLDIIKEYAQIDSRIRWRHRGNRGVAETLNELLDLSQGKYIARMDADDVSYPRRLEIQMKYLKKYPECACVGSAITVFSEGNEKKTQKYCLSVSKIRTSMIFQCEFAHPTIMFNSMKIEKSKLKYSTEYATEDYELWSRIVYDYCCANIKKPLLYYRLHNNNITLTTAEKIKDSTIKVQEKICQMFGADIVLNHEIIQGADSIEGLEQIEEGLLRMIQEKGREYWNLGIFRRRVNILYYNTEKRLGILLGRQTRYWEKFGELYGVQYKIIKWVDILFFSMKDYLFLK